MKLKYSLAVLTTTSLLLASCGTESGDRNVDKKVLDIEMPLKTTSIAPYETDVPVRAGALESLFKVSKEEKYSLGWLKTLNRSLLKNWN